MQTKIRHNDGLCLIEIIGELDHHSAARLAKILDTAIASDRVDELRLDLRRMTFMDSSGIGVLIGRYKRLRQSGAVLSVTNPNQVVDRILRMSGLYQICNKVG
jgi:stage II sporulation protein AA (anti-sigma F factor antagonist)